MSKILIVEDEEHQRELYTAELTEEGLSDVLSELLE